MSRLIAGVEDVAALAVAARQHDVGDLDFARSPAAFGGAEHVGGRRRGLDRMIRQHRRGRLVGRHGHRRLLGPGVAGGQLLFLAHFDVGDVGADDPLRIAHALLRAAIEPQRLVAEALDHAERVGDEQDGLAAALELRELVEALVREALVADGEHFVHQQHVGIDVNRHREAEAHVHAGRIGLHRRVDEVLELGELDDLVEAAGDLALGEAEHDAVDEHVLAPGDLRVEPRAELDQRRDPSVDGARCPPSAW